LEISSTSSVQFHIDKLVKHGLVQRRGSRRTITELGHSVLQNGRLAA
jgi:hypothetical protein